MSGRAAGHTRQRADALGLKPGVMASGPGNTITDVAGVSVGHKTLIEGDSVRTGVTAILPHDGNLYQEKAPAAVHVANGFGKLAGSTQVRELGVLETPILLTNTLSVAAGVEALVRYTLDQPGNEQVRSVNALVGETNDGYLNDIRAMRVTAKDVRDAIDAAGPGAVAEGCVGAGTGTMCFGYKGGIGTASRLAKCDGGAYTVGVLVQANFGGELTIMGVPVGRALREDKARPQAETSGDGSCMIVVATDAPLCVRNLDRLAKRAVIGMGRSGSYLANGSGDYVVAFSTAYRIGESGDGLHEPVALMSNDAMNPLFQAVAEATEEAVYNALMMATTLTGRDGHTGHALPAERVVGLCGRGRDA